MGHTLSRQERSSYGDGGFVCNLCKEDGCGPLFHCSDCDYDVHLHCAATQKQQTHFSHPQHLLHLSHRSSHARVCDSCGGKIHAWSFRCEICDFDVHPTCVRAPKCILHSQHPHPLTLLQQSAELPGYEECSGCRTPANRFCYRCSICAFNLHQVCATLPSKVKHPTHPAHPLTLLDRPSFQEGLTKSRCSRCGEQVQGWHFCCADCKFNLHPVCADVVHGYDYGNAQSAACDQSDKVAAASAVWVPRNVHDVSHKSSDSMEVLSPVSSALGLSVKRAEGMASLPTSFPSNEPPKSSAVTTQAVSNPVDLLHMPLHLFSQIPFPSKEDWEAVQRVLWFSQEMARGHLSVVAQNSVQIHPDDEVCPACHKGYDCWNPKRSTSCGHHFHLACILDCLKRSDLCPICRKDLKILL